MQRVQSHDLKQSSSLPWADRFTALEIRAFGRLQIKHNDHVISSFPTRKTEELLAFLLLNLGNPQSRDRLIEMLWPGISPELGRGRLSTTLWRVRVILEDLGLIPNHYLESNSESIALSLHPQTFFDVRLFQEHLGASKTAQSNEDMASHLRAAEDLCGGELLEEIYSDWCLIERERLARLRLFGLGQLTACFMEQESYDEAIELCQRMLDLDSLREEVHRALMVCYAETGRRSDAIRQFQLCANLLLDELGIFPLPETIDVYKSIISKAADERIGLDADSNRQEQLEETFSEFITLGDKLVKLIDNTQ